MQVLGLDEIAKKWDARYAKVCFEALGHDDALVRSKAKRMLMAHVDRSFDPDVKALLQDLDLRKRAAVISLAIKLWGKKGVEEVRPWLKADAQILRYYALFVLYEDLRIGRGAGKTAIVVVMLDRNRQNSPFDSVGKTNAMLREYQRS